MIKIYIVEVKGKMNCQLPLTRLPVPVNKIDNTWCAAYAGEVGQCKLENVCLQKIWSWWWVGQCLEFAYANNSCCA